MRKLRLKTGQVSGLIRILRDMLKALKNDLCLWLWLFQYFLNGLYALTANNMFKTHTHTYAMWQNVYEGMCIHVCECGVCAYVYKTCACCNLNMKVSGQPWASLFLPV